MDGFDFPTRTRRLATMVVAAGSDGTLRVAAVAHPLRTLGSLEYLKYCRQLCSGDKRELLNRVEGHPDQRWI
jgi:hypothetical protein